MAEVLERFPQLKDPRSGQPLMTRTILVANTSNMPIAAREASIYTGITMAEYFRDMGYDVALMADSTSRWAEALRDISGRLEEIPAERGYPAYLAERIAEFYERAGKVVTLGSERRVGSVTIMGAVSPPGGDFSEPVTSITMRFIETLWALDKELAFRRHFPAINWLISFSRYIDSVRVFWEKYDPDFVTLRGEAMSILEESSRIEHIARIVGEKALPEDQRLILLAAELIREGFLTQNAYHEVDTYCPPEKQVRMLRAFVEFYRLAKPLVEKGVPVDRIRGLRVMVDLLRMKEYPEVEHVDEVMAKLKEQLSTLAAEYGLELEVLGGA